MLATRHVDEAAAAAGLHHAVAREERDGADRVLARLDLLEVVEGLHVADLAELTREKDDKSFRKFFTPMICTFRLHKSEVSVEFYCSCKISSFVSFCDLCRYYYGLLKISRQRWSGVHLGRP